MDKTKKLRALDLKKNKLQQYDSSYDAISTPNAQEADCIQGVNSNDEYWTMDDGYFLCHENEIIELDENCDNNANKDASKTISDLRKSGIDIPDIDELSSLPILNATRGILGKVGNKKVAPQPKKKCSRM